MTRYYMKKNQKDSKSFIYALIEILYREHIGHVT